MDGLVFVEERLALREGLAVVGTLEVLGERLLHRGTLVGAGRLDGQGHQVGAVVVVGREDRVDPGRCVLRGEGVLDAGRGVAAQPPLHPHDLTESVPPNI